MAYVADYARSWSQRRKDKAIERSVDRAMADVRRAERIARSERAAKVYEAQTAVAGLPDSYHEDMGRKYGITANQAEAVLMRQALSRPELVLLAIQNTKRKLGLA